MSILKEELSLTTGIDIKENSTLRLSCEGPRLSSRHLESLAKKNNLALYFFTVITNYTL